MRKLLMAVTVLLMAVALAGAENSRPSFKDADADHDGGLSYEEYKKVQPDATPEMFRNLDKDHNDILDPREFIIIAR